MKKHLSLLLTVFCFCYLNSSLAQNFNQFDTDNGYIRLGPKNNSFAHIETDKSRFYFNKAIQINSGRIGSYSNQDFSLRTGHNTRMTIKGSNGFVGIGTTNPQESLHVNGHILIPSDKKLKIGSAYNSNSGYMTIANSSSCYNTAIDIKGNLYFRNTNQSIGVVENFALAIQKNGSILINVKEKYDNSIVNTQGYKLMVNGGILCEELKVISDVPNSDYVFESDYPLKSLKEVEEFITINKHLPEVPSSKVFKEEGYKVGEMDDLLLRKVEELTLYVIQLKKEIEELKVK